jgi:copper(I)-binding protein
MRKNTNIKKILGIILFLTTLTLASCQAAGTAPEIVIEDAWGRPSPKVAAAGAFYMVIKNKGGEMD